MGNLETAIRTEPKEIIYPAFDNVFFDVDSCLVGIEGIDELANIHNCGPQIAALTASAMDGGISYSEIFGRRLDIIQPRKEDMAIVADRYMKSITPGAREVIEVLHAQGVRVWLLSGGFSEAIYPLADYLGVSRGNVFGNHIHFHPDGSYKGFDQTSPLCRQFGKREFIKALKEFDIVKGKTVIIGDGIAEVEAREVTDFCIGFGGHKVRNNVRAGADMFIEEQTFYPLLPVLLRSDGDVQF